MGVVQSDIKGVQLFLGELDKGHKRQQEAIKAAADASRDQFNRNMQLADRGLIARVGANGEQTIEAMSPEEDQMFKTQLRRKEDAALHDAGLESLIMKMKAGQAADFAESPENKRLIDIERRNQRETDAINAQRLDVAAQNAANRKIRIAESDAGQKLSKREIENIQKEEAAKVRGRLSGSISPEGQELAEENKRVLLEGQLATLKMINRSNPDVDIAPLVEQLGKGIPVPESVINNLFSHSIKVGAAANERKAESARMLGDIKNIVGTTGQLNENSSSATIKQTLDAVLKPGEKPKDLTTADLNAYNKDVATTSGLFEQARALQNFVKKIEEGKGVAFDDEISIPLLVHEMFPKMLEGRSTMEAGDTDLFRKVKEKMSLIQSQ